jgi:hypothetical protein
MQLRKRLLKGWVEARAVIFLVGDLRRSDFLAVDPLSAIQSLERPKAAGNAGRWRRKIALMAVAA